MSDSVGPHRRQPTRLLRSWASPGKNTGVGWHFLLQCMKVKVAQLCPTLRDPMNCSPPGSSIRGIFQARVLEWGAIAFSDYVLDYSYFGYALAKVFFIPKKFTFQCWKNVVKGKLYREYIPEYEYMLSVRGPYKTNNESKIGRSKPKGNWERWKILGRNFQKVRRGRKYCLRKTSSSLLCLGLRISGKGQ